MSLVDVVVDGGTTSQVLNLVSETLQRRVAGNDESEHVVVVFEKLVDVRAETVHVDVHFVEIIERPSVCG